MIAVENRDKRGRASYKHLPLHAKNVSKLILSNLLQLPSSSQQILLSCKEQSRWLTDITMYNAVPRHYANEIPYTRMSKADIDTFVTTGALVPIEAADVRGDVNFFDIPEWSKNRRRPIKQTKTINAALGKETIDQDMNIAGKKQIFDIIMKGEFCAAFDAAQFYDALCVAPEIGALMCCKKGKKCYRVGTAPMGMRQSVQVAQRIMQQLVNIPGDRTERAVCIDNGLLVGDFGSVKYDLVEARDRAKTTNLTLNEAEELENDIDGCIVQSTSWGGISFDLRTKETWLTEKVIKKIEISWGNRERWSIRGFAAHTGLLFWSLGIIDVPLYNYFPLLQFISNTSRRMLKKVTVSVLC